MAGIKNNGKYEDAQIEKDTRLYRIVKSAYSDQSCLLNGMGGYYSQSRYNYIGQLTSYCSDNIFLCMAEVLFHMYEVSLKKLKNNSFTEFQAESHKFFELVVFNCKEKKNLIYIDSSVGKNNYKLNSSAITHSDTIYRELQDACHRIRLNHRDGIVAPSARHSHGSVVVLFGDNTSIIDHIEHKFFIELSLLKEDLSCLANDPKFDPIADRISQSIGYFKFDHKEFIRYNILLSPLPTKYEGGIDFNRIYYSATYPGAVIR